MDEHEMTELGAAMAAATHDLNNVFAIIKEADGLGMDILEADRGSTIRAERLEKVLNRIRDQVDRGTQMVSQLNRFAHRLDEPTQTVAAADVLEHVTFLRGRSVRLRQARLVTAASDERLRVEAPVFRLCLALGAAIGSALEQTRQDDEVVMGARQRESAVVFEIAIHRAGEPIAMPWTDEGLAPWQRTVTSYGGRLERSPDDRGLRWVLPAGRPASAEDHMKPVET